VAAEEAIVEDEREKPKNQMNFDQHDQKKDDKVSMTLVVAVGDKA